MGERSRADFRIRLSGRQLRHGEQSERRTSHGKESCRGGREKGWAIDMKTKFVVVIAGISLLFAAMPLLAHHAFAAEYDASKPLKLKGKVTKWELVNPHSWIHLDVTGPDGKVTEWMVEGGSPNSLLRNGFN